MSIRVQHLSKFYGKQKVLDDVNFETQNNRIIGFLGPNGAGKSTTMKSLAGIIPIDNGKCWINDIDIKNNPSSAKRLIGYLPENNPLYTEMYVKEMLHYHASLLHLDLNASAISNVISKTGLQAEQNKKIKELSKGFRQRVGLACAILHNPKVLILDEPTTGLDPNQIIEIRQLIRELGQDKTVLLSTHLMQEVEAICDEIIIIHKGQIKTQFMLKDKIVLFPDMSMEDIFVSFTK